MKKDKNFYLNLSVFISMPILCVAGGLIAKLSKNNRVVALGGLLICLALFVLSLWLVRVTAARSAKREVTQKDISNNYEAFKLYNGAFKAFQNNTDYPQTNTVKIVNEVLEFFAEGRYVCEKDFKGVKGNHLAFEIKSTSLKSKPDGYDDICDLEGNGVLISVGYNDSQALEEYVNDNGVILKDTIENSIGKTIKLKQDEGYNLCVSTAECDDVDFGFLKILKYENDVLTVNFLLNVPFGLNDKVEGVVELNKDATEESDDIQSLINKIKSKKYNTIEVSDEDLNTIKQANESLPESYIEFLKEVGFADLNWIDVGRNCNASTNLSSDEESYVKDLMKDNEEFNLDEFYFFGVDNGGSYYAFSRKNDGKVYSFSEDDSQPFTYETFEKFLSEILSLY